MQRGERTDQAGQEVRGRVLPVRTVATVPDRHLVDLQVRDRLHLGLDQLRQLLRHHEQAGELGAAGCGDDLAQTFGLAREHGHEARRLGFHDQPDAVRLALLHAASALRLGLGERLDALLLDFGGHHDVGVLRRLLALRTSPLGGPLSFVRLLESLRLFDLLSRAGAALRFGLGLAAVGVRTGDGHLGCVLTLDGRGACRRHLHALIALGHGSADLAALGLLGDPDLGLVDRARCGFLAQCVDVAGLVRDVLDVHVDEPQADLLQLDFHAVRDVLDQLVAVGVDLLDRHRGDDDTHLTEDDVASELLDLALRLTQDALGRVFHHARLGGDAHREGRGRVHTDVLLRQRALELDVDGNGGQVQELVVLDDGPHERGATVVAPGGKPLAADLAVDDEDPVRGAALVASCECDPRRKHEDDEDPE